MAKYKKSSARYNRKVERSTKHALPIPIPTEPLREFCRRNHIRRLAVFGSALRNDFRPDSDIDLLVEFEPDHTPSLLQMARLERELSAFFDGRKIDLRTKEDLSRYFRDAVVSTARVVYKDIGADSGTANSPRFRKRSHPKQQETPPKGRTNSLLPTYRGDA
jgi:hypothetical protein